MQEIITAVAACLTLMLAGAGAAVFIYWKVTGIWRGKEQQIHANYQNHINQISFKLNRAVQIVVDGIKEEVGDDEAKIRAELQKLGL